MNIFIKFHKKQTNKLGFYLPCPNLKKSPEKFLSNSRKNSRGHSKRLEDFSVNHSKYDCSKFDDPKTNNNSVYFNEKSIIQNIKFKKSQETSKMENDDSLNFTYFSKEIGLLNQKKSGNYHVLKGFFQYFLSFFLIKIVYFRFFEPFEKKQHIFKKNFLD